MTKRLLAMLLLVCCLVAGQTAWAAAPFKVPAEVQQLMPAEATAIFAVSSANELADRYVAVMAELGEGEDATREDIFQGLGSSFPGFLTEVDRDRPLFAVAGLPNLMGGGEPPFMIIVPLLPAAAKADTLAIASKLGASYRVGNYAALAKEGTLAPADGSPALASHLAAGTISATLDLAGVVTSFRPFIEMGLAGIPIEDEATGTEGMTAEEATALKTLLRDAMDSVTRLDMSLGHDGDFLTWHTGLGIVPGSVLDPGPQPDFQRAQALTAALPQDADFLQVIALDQTRVFATFQDYYLTMMKDALSGMDAEQSAKYGAWVEDYLNNMAMWANPMAAALSLGEEGMSAHMIMETDDAKGTLAMLDKTLSGMAELGIGYDVTRQKDQKVAGVKFQVWDININLEQFEKVMPDQEGPALAGTDRMQAEQLVSILQRIMPTLYLGAKDGKLFMASDKDTEGLAAMVKKARQKGQPVASIAAIARTAGPGCQQVISGDMLSIINWATDIMSEMDEKEHAVLTDNPIPFQADVTIDGADYGVDVGMDLPALGNLIRAGKALEQAEEDKED